VNSYESWIVTTYDDAVAEVSEAGGIALADAENLVVARFVKAVRERKIPKPKQPTVEEIAHQLFRRYVPPQRTKRREHLPEDLDYILDALKNPDESAHIDPLLKLAVPLGTRDGQDRTLGLWTPENFAASSLTRYRNAAEVTAAAKEYDERAQLIIEKMQEKSAAFARDLFAAE
jgi:hypothetical protein